jgi:hypothetical protein
MTRTIPEHKRAIPEQMPLLMVFATAQAALAHKAAAGGWVFVPDDCSNSTWFDAAYFTPTPIMLHPMTRGKNGRLL